MVRPDHVEHPVVGPRAGSPLRVFLEAALRALEGGGRPVGQELGGRKRRQPVADWRPAEVEVDRSNERLERRCEQRRPAPATALRFTLAEQQQLTELDARRETREAGGGDDGSPAGGEGALVVPDGGRRGLGDGEADDDVAEELEPLVVAAATSRCSCSQLECVSACSSRSRSRTGRASRVASVWAWSTTPVPAG